MGKFRQTIQVRKNNFLLARKNLATVSPYAKYTFIVSVGAPRTGLPFVLPVSFD